MVPPHKGGVKTGDELCGENLGGLSRIAFGGAVTLQYEVPRGLMMDGDG